MPQSVPGRRLLPSRLRRGFARGRPRGAFLLALATVAVASSSLLATSPAAVAHATLVSSSPADGATVLAPSEVVLTFDDAVGQDAAVVVTGPGGSVVDATTQVTGRVVTARLSVSATGRYQVAFRVVSEDGHPVAGRVGFRVTDDPGDVRATGGSAGADDGGSGATSRVLGMVAGLAVLLGLGLLTVRRWAPGLWTKQS